MHSRLLAAVAFISSLGVVGCDDPEVQDKVESVLLHGSVEAYAHCYTATSKNLCNGTSGQYFAFKAYKFQDGSSYLKFSRNGQGYQQFNHRDLTIRADDLSENGSTGYFGEVDNGYLNTRAYCSSLASEYTDSINIDANMTCTGFNLEAFGITP